MKDSIIGDNADDSSDKIVQCGVSTCSHSLEVEVLSAGSEMFPAGLYSFDIVAPDGSAYWLDCILPHEEGTLDCMGGDTDLLSAMMDRSGTEMFFHVVGAPAYMWLTISLNDMQIGQRRIEPDYAREYPNGAGCAPECYVGDSAIAVAF